MAAGLLVYADTHQRYAYWCHQNHYSPRNPLLLFVHDTRHTQGQPEGMPILCVDSAPGWLADEIDQRGFRRVSECPQPLTEFVRELDDYDYTIADVQSRFDLQDTTSDYADTWQTKWITRLVFLLVVLMVFYAGYLIGRGGCVG